ncbi:lipopolysaccharide biosynthesis protein [Micromonosporaceae bacterium Da 78-11]
MSSATAERRQGARSGLIGLAGAAVSGLFGFLLAMVVARGFGPAGSGAIFTAIGLLTVVSAVCCLGADTGLVWALPRRPTATRPGGLLTVALVPALSAALIVAGVGLVTAGPLAGVLLPEAGDGTRLLTVALVAVPAVVLMTILLSAVRSARPIGWYAAIQFVLLPIGRPLLVGAVAIASAGVVLAMTGWVLPVVVAIVACLLAVRRPLGLGAADGWRPSPGDWPTFWSYALPRAVSAAIDSGGMWVGVLLTAALATQADAGVFGGVGRYVLAGQLALQGLRVAVAPQLSRLLGSGHTQQAAAVHRQTTALAIALSWPAYLLLGLFAPAFLGLFGGEFVAGATAMAVLAAAMLVNVGLGTVQTVLLMSGRSGRHLMATSAGLACTVGLSLWWIPTGGVVGAACAWAAGIVVENVLCALAAREVIGSAVLSRAAQLTAFVTAVVVGSAATVAILIAGRGPAGLLLALGLLAVASATALTSRRVRDLLRSRAALLRPHPTVSEPAAPAGTDQEEPS